MIGLAWALVVAQCCAGAAYAADVPGYRKPYFGATLPGAWAQYTMKTEGQPDMGYLSTRLSDDAGQQRVQIRIEYMMAGKSTTAFTDYMLKPGYALEKDALGFGKALSSMSSWAPGSKPTFMPAAALESARKTMPDYAPTARFVGTENIGGKLSDRYAYTQRHPGNPAQIETGELWLSDTVPFGMVRQKAVTAEESGKVVSRFEMLLVDSGVKAAASGSVSATKPSNDATSAPVALAEAFKRGLVELSVAVAPGTDNGKNVRVVFKNKREQPLRLVIPAGLTTLDAGIPIDRLRLQAAAAKTIDLPPGGVSPAVDLNQTIGRRPIEGTFTLSVYEGVPLFSGNVTMGTGKS